MEAGKRFRINFIILSLGYILVGLSRIFLTDPTSVLICYIIGGVAIVAGLIRLILYFRKDGEARIFRNDLAIGVILILVGIYVLARPHALLDELPLLFGFFIIFDSVLKLQYSVDLRRAQFHPWWIILILSVITAILGVLLVLNTFVGEVLFYYFGIVLVVDGLANLLTLALLVIALKRKAKRDKKAAETAADATAAPTVAPEVGVAPAGAFAVNPVAPEAGTAPVGAFAVNPAAPEANPSAALPSDAAPPSWGDVAQPTPPPPQAGPPV